MFTHQNIIPTLMLSLSLSSSSYWTPRGSPHAWFFSTNVCYVVFLLRGHQPESVAFYLYTLPTALSFSIRTIIIFVGCEKKDSKNYWAELCMRAHGRDFREEKERHVSSVFPWKKFGSSQVVANTLFSWPFRLPILVWNMLYTLLNLRFYYFSGHSFTPWDYETWEWTRRRKICPWSIVYYHISRISPDREWRGKKLWVLRPFILESEKNDLRRREPC